MNNIAYALANGLWYGLSLPQSIAFRRSLKRVAEIQERLLMRLLRRNAASEYGQHYHFAAIRSVAEYQARVPLTTYEDYEAAVQRIGARRPAVLTSERVLLLEPTSGSTAATKHIPYTAALKREFQRAIAPWVVDLLGHNPALLCGQAYWSVTPVARRGARSPGGIPLGFEEDSEYFGFLQRHLINATLAVPPQVKLIDEMEAFRYVTLLFLLRSRCLRLISVWNPTFLTLLVARLEQWWPQLAEDIARGTLRPPARLDPDLRARLGLLNAADPRRAEEVRLACRQGGPAGQVHARLWPELRVLSCWTEGYAARYVPEIRRLFPQARVQGKGLLATEGVVSLPLSGQPGAALALRSHFFEFVAAVQGRDTAADERPLLAHELERDGLYSVVLTTGGGLYRYRLHDLVQVVGHLDACPLLRFIGKEAHISDHFGEKLSERHVQQALGAALDRHAARPAFAMVACDELGESQCYTLFIEAPECSDRVLLAIARALEERLVENYHYRYCRELGQLGPLQVFRITGGGIETYLSRCQEQGQRAGDIKPVALHQRRGWSQAFTGAFVAEAC